MNGKTPVSSAIQPAYHDVRQAFHVFALEPGVVPEWIPLLPAGEFAGRDGRGPYRNTTISTVMEQFAAWGMPLEGDYEHQSLHAPKNGQPAPRAGGVNVLEEREGMVWGKVEWTQRAAAMIAAKEYLYISPVFDHLPDGTIVRLTGWTLTNNPNLYLPAIARRGASPGTTTKEAHAMDKERASELLRRLIYTLNLPETSTEDEVMAHVQRVMDSLKSTQAAMSQLRGLLGVAEGADAAAVASAAQSRLDNPDPSRFVPRAEFERVAHSLARVEGEQKAAAAEQAVSAAMTARKVSPGMKDWATAYATRDPEGFRDYVAGAPVIVTDGEALAAAHRAGAGGDKHPLVASAESRAGK